MNAGNGHASAAEFEDLNRRLAALETRVDQELVVMQAALHKALEFEQSLNSRLEIIHQMVATTMSARSRPGANAADARKVERDIPACDVELDARIRALRKKLAAPEHPGA